jgi:hypothetical protein
VQAKDYITLTFVYIMNAEAIHLQVVRLVRKTGQICEAIFGCTENCHVPDLESEPIIRLGKRQQEEIQCRYDHHQDSQAAQEFQHEYQAFSIVYLIIERFTTGSVLLIKNGFD